MNGPPVRIDVQNGESLRPDRSGPLARAVPTAFYLDGAGRRDPSPSTTAA